MTAPCPNCQHPEAHDTAGIGVCRASDCGCDNTRPDTPVRAHDRLCPLSNGCACPWMADAGAPCDDCTCTCDIIAPVRAEYDNHPTTACAHCGKPTCGQRLPLSASASRVYDALFTGPTAVLSWKETEDCGMNALMRDIAEAAAGALNN